MNRAVRGSLTEPELLVGWTDPAELAGLDEDDGREAGRVVPGTGCPSAGRARRALSRRVLP
ncbi:hypothetical protein EKO23_21190 [Nocardioides guangzhouensis]|uniref:Uncharacterized protein n=1 Tax=Nocardioides guangzhouensis TaxID=2497878 RepID=A0A4Q4Z5H9_9ACTN|nr:hypothetical protein [Nocardioides guangzhouensis]RYP82698.1 hypothetical protein EKO23_21190 [Nocardioides guangzhouensis]